MNYIGIEIEMQLRKVQDNSEIRIPVPTNNVRVFNTMEAAIQWCDENFRNWMVYDDWFTHLSSNLTLD
jgi:hypothetical protein